MAHWLPDPVPRWLSVQAYGARLVLGWHVHVAAWKKNNGMQHHGNDARK